MNKKEWAWFSLGVLLLVFLVWMGYQETTLRRFKMETNFERIERIEQKLDKVLKEAADD